MQRKTIAKEITISGIGLHKGQPISLQLLPSANGIIFEREGVSIPASPASVVDTRLNTTLGRDDQTIATVEHMMAALWGLGLTDITIKVSGDEMPAMDGSAKLFTEQIQAAGLKDLDGKLAPIMIKDTLRVEMNDAWVEITPGDFAIDYRIIFPEAAIGEQHYHFDGRDFGRLIAPARTFGRLSDVEKMRSMGLSLGGSLDNAIVIDEDKIMNPEGLRFEDEFVRHKVLDILGDLWILGRPLQGSIRAFKANHMLHCQLAAKIAELEE